ncbi:tRNA pseudouridine(38-40) synthase TruA [Robiginitalea sp. SC105]|uniref:tRNA pseudouridine synthase A n=1 Tax=Robiginitalea sp. SC105 TaxID=2762332 RepID=UPI001639CD2E|nr:hypothetical protein [Robiginitalea sp. SC105]MBC2840591.1 hypothetical protein [Robiginitalea sp. SC105]
MRRPSSHHFLLRLEFLGFRFHGWQEQPGKRTVSGMLQKTFRFALPEAQVKLIGAGRTDARVSARDFAVLVIAGCPEKPHAGNLLEALNANLPPDIRASSLHEVSREFNPIRDCEQKTYRYYFYRKGPPDPYVAPFVAYLPGIPELHPLEEAARLFIGTRDFRCFTASPTPEKKYVRQIDECRIVSGEVVPGIETGFRADMLEISGPGFGRNQVRLIMAALVAVGRGEVRPETLQSCLETGEGWSSQRVAPASGLHLVRTVFKAGTT